MLRQLSLLVRPFSGYNPLSNSTREERAMTGLRSLAILFVALAFTLPQVADAQMGMGKRGKRGMMGGGDGMMGRGGEGPPGGGGGLRAAFLPMGAELDAMRERGFFATGLEPVYPGDADCLKIDSPFASQKRYDGSWRNQRYYHGYHGGADMSADEGTPILAVADGTVVHKSGGGGGIGGIGIVLQHAPDDTGLGVWAYTEYKHLREMPDLAEGQRVRMGEVIAFAGKTGTTGGRAYGPAGHSHLHLTAFYSESDGYMAKRMLIPEDGWWMDPVALFKAPPIDSATLKDLPDSEKRVVIPYKTTDGHIVPEGTKVVWPFACSPK